MPPPGHPPHPVVSTLVSERLVIVGGGVAGFRMAENLVQGGYAGAITVINADPVFACNRPLLSKSYLEGSAERADLTLPSRHGAGYTVVAGNAESIDAATRVVHASRGAFPYDRLVIATGLSPRLLHTDGSVPQMGLSTLHDVEHLRDHIASGSRITVVGGGTLALEAASSLTTLGADVTLVTRSDRPLRRTVGAHISYDLTTRMQGAGLNWAIGDNIRIFGSSLLINEREHASDLVVCAIGSVPSRALLPRFVPTGASGIPVDHEFRALTDPSVVVVGDMAIWPDGRSHPHWFAAMESARRAAKGICGTTREGGEPPFVHSFWSDQWGVRLQAFGSGPQPGGGEHLRVDDETGIVTAFTNADGVVRGVVASSPQGQPSPALAWRARLGAPLPELAPVP